MHSSRSAVKFCPPAVQSVMCSLAVASAQCWPRSPCMQLIRVSLLDHLLADTAPDHLKAMPTSAPSRCSELCLLEAVLNVGIDLMFHTSCCGYLVYLVCITGQFAGCFAKGGHRDSTQSTPIRLSCTRGFAQGYLFFHFPTDPTIRQPQSASCHWQS